MGIKKNNMFVVQYMLLIYMYVHIIVVGIKWNNKCTVHCTACVSHTVDHTMSLTIFFTVCSEGS